MPGQLIEAWIGEEIEESAVVMALLALVAIAHQPIYLLTQFLIARARQQQIARVLVIAAAANAGFSVVLAATVGIWGVALTTLVVDVAVLTYIIPVLAAPAAATRPADLARAILRPVPPALAVAVVVFLGIGRIGDLDTRLELLPLGCFWALSCSAAVWRFGFDGAQRRVISRQLLRPPAAAAE
jgi:O-antigen/teichoic acid export membrane protein